MQTIIEVKNLTHVYTDSENKEIKGFGWDQFRNKTR